MTDEQLAEIEAQARSVASRSQWYYLLDDAAFGRLAAEETVPDLLAEVRRLRALVGEPAPTVRWADSTEWRESDEV